MNVPPVNVVMAFDPTVINTLKTSKTLEAFEEATKGNKNVKILKNGPGSNLLSLTHEYNMGGGKSASLILEFLDPEGTFEDSMLSFGLVNDVPAKVSSFQQRLEKAKQAAGPPMSQEEDLEDRLRKVQKDYALGTDKKTFGEELKNALARVDTRTQDFLKSKELHDQMEGYFDLGAGPEPHLGVDMGSGHPRLLVAGDREENDIKAYLTEQARRSYILDEVPSLQTKFDEVGRLHDLAEVFEGGDKLDLLQILEIEAANVSLLERTVYITYGVGNDFRHWAPTMVFNRANGASYDFTGDGIRKLTIEYTGVSISVNLTALGLAPLAALGIGQVFKGQSAPIFRKEDSEAQLKMYEDLAMNHSLVNINKPHDEGSPTLKRLFSDPYRPSIHQTFTDIFKSYIMGATGYKNVIIAFPDLDKLLSHVYHQNLLNAFATFKVKGDDPKDVTRTYLEFRRRQGGGSQDIEEILVDKSPPEVRVAAWREFIQHFGFRMTENNRSGLQNPVDSTNARREEFSKPEPLDYYFAKKDCRIVLSDDAYSDLLQENKLIEPLQRVMNKIVKALVDTAPHPVSMNGEFVVETDIDMINLMTDKFMLPDKGKPVLVFGDSLFIRKFLYGEILAAENAAPTSNSKQGDVDYLTVSILDEAKGLDADYLDQAFSIRNPDVGSVFDPKNALDTTHVLPGDSNILTHHTDNQYGRTRTHQNMPVFTLGTAHTNILSLNLDIDKQFLDLINKFVYQTKTTPQAVKAIIPKDKINAVYGLLKDVAEAKLNEKGPNGIPEGFAQAVDKYIHTEVGIGLLGLTFTTGQYTAWPAMELGFKELGLGFLEGDALTQDKNSATFKTKEDAIMWFWRRFEAMTISGLDGIIMEIGGAKTTKAIVNHSTLVADRVAALSFLGSMKTLPMFHLASAARVVQKSSLLYAVEPPLMGLDPISKNKIKDQRTWFSGVYSLLGFKHTVSPTSADSEFAFSRVPSHVVSM